MEKLRINNKEFQDASGKRKSLKPFYSCTDRSKWNLLTISDVLLKETTGPELSEWGQQDLVSQETEEDYEGGYNSLPEVIFLT